MCIRDRVDAGAQDAMQYGVLAGYPLVNLKVTLLDGQYHDVCLLYTSPSPRDS